MSKKTLPLFLLPLLLLLGDSSGNSADKVADGRAAENGTLEKMIVASGSVSMDLQLDRLNGVGSTTKEARTETLRFEVAPNSLFPIIVFNNVLRGPTPGSLGLIPGNYATLPEALRASVGQLVIEKIPFAEAFDIVVRDGKTGFLFFNIEGNTYDFDATTRALSVKGGRLLVSEQFANALGRPAEAGAVVGSITISTVMYPIEAVRVANGEVQSATLPPLHQDAPGNPEAISTGPDVIVGDLPALQQFGSSGTQVGLSVGTTSCNAGTVELNWFAMPNTDHPVIPQNLYRMSGGANNNDRIEQIGQSWLKHGFTALQNNACSFGCAAASNGTHLGVGCSDPYDASLNSTQSGLGSRAWVNAFTGAFPNTSRDHTGHTHNGTSHRILVEGSDLNMTQNAGATYYAEAQYVTPHEYVWCQGHPGECNMYNNVSYRRFNVSGTTNFTFSAVGATVRMDPAIKAWTGATIAMMEPAPGVDGRGFIAYKVTGPVGGVYHYEYAVYNQNLDRAIQSFSLPLGCGITVSNLGFHAPLNPPGSANDGTTGSAGFSNAAWSPTQTATALSWNSETLTQNANANAIRWSSMYNFRFDSNRPPAAANATVGFFKTGAPITVGIQGPSPDICASPLTMTSAVSRKVHGGAGPFDVQLPGVESRSGGTDGNHTIVVTFNNNVVDGKASVNSRVGRVSGGPVFSGNTMTLNLTGFTDVQTFSVVLNDITDNAGQVMPAANVNVGLLIGDSTNDGFVNSGDTLQTRNRSGQDLDMTNFRSDVNGDGVINSGDALIVRQHSGNNVTMP